MKQTIIIAKNQKAKIAQIHYSEEHKQIPSMSKQICSDSNQNEKIKQADSGRNLEVR